MDFMNSLIILIICCVQRHNCYDITAHGIVDLNKDGGWSQFGAACVGVQALNSNWTIVGTPAGTVNIKFTAPFNAPRNDTEYMLVMYDDQTNSFPNINNTYMSCEEKVDGYYKLRRGIALHPGTSWNRTISIHQHSRTRWWYFYLVNCDESLIFAPITYVYSYKDNTNDTQICAKPSKTHGIQSMIRALIGVIVIIFIGICVLFGVKYRKKHRMKQKKK
eukprot:195478_1